MYPTRRVCDGATILSHYPFRIRLGLCIEQKILLKYIFIIIITSGHSQAHFTHHFILELYFLLRSQFISDSFIWLLYNLDI